MSSSVAACLYGADLSAGRLPAAAAGMDVLFPGCEPLSNGGGGGPGTDLEDERPTPVGSPSSAVDECMPFSPTSGMDLEVAHALLEVGVLPAMVTPIVDPAVGFPLTPATYPVPPIPLMSFGDSVPLEVAPPAGLAVGSPARSETLLCRVSSPASVASSRLSPSSPVSRFAPDVSQPSGLAAMDHEIPWSASLPLGVSADSPLLPAPLTPSQTSILSNVQVLQQLVTSLNRTSSEVMRVAFGRAPFPADAMHRVVLPYRVRRAAHYMAAMGLWQPPSSQGVWGPLPSATCNACMSCSDCFPDLP